MLGGSETCQDLEMTLWEPKKSLGAFKYRLLKRPYFEQYFKTGSWYNLVAYHDKTSLSL